MSMMKKSKMYLVDAMIFSLTLISTSPATSSEYGEAADYARRAILAQESVKKRIKRLENQAKNLTGLDDDTLVYFSWTIPLATGKITTKPFKNFKTDLFGGTLRPELEYKFTGDTEFNSMLIYQYRF